MTQKLQWQPPDPIDPAPADWRDLSEEYRASNRARAAHIGAKLVATVPTILMVAGYRLARSVDLDRGEIDAV